MSISKAALRRVDRRLWRFVFESQIVRTIFFAAVVVFIGSAITDTLGRPLHLFWLFPLFLSLFIFLFAAAYFLAAVASLRRRQLAQGTWLLAVAAALFGFCFVCFQLVFDPRVR